MANSREESLNALLALLLDKYRGISASHETSSKMGAVELTVSTEGKDANRILIEARIGDTPSKRRKSAQRARSRLAKLPDTLAFAVCYPQHLRDSADSGATKKTLAESIIAFAAIQRFGDGPVWREGTVADLADSLRDADLTRQRVLEAIEGSVRDTAELLRQGGCAEELAAALTIPARGKDLQAAPLIAAMVLSNAALLHRRLRSVPNLADMTPIEQALEQPDRAAELIREAWEWALDVDYYPVFAPAVAVLRAIPAPVLERPLLDIAENAVLVADELPSLRLEHLGPLCHRLLASAKFDGAIYTNTVTALLLARLALPADGQAWSDSAALAKLRVIDPACGTGTLLLAAMHTIRERIEQAAGHAPLSDALQRALEQDVAHGLDISEHGVHLAASNLALGSPRLDCGPVNLVAMPHGPQAGDEAAAGSLELLADAIAPGSDASEGAGRESGLATSKSLSRPFDMVIMNPPVARNDPRNRQYDSRSRGLVQRREAEIADLLRGRDSNAFKAIDHSNPRTFFSPLADALLKGSDGVLAEVLPTTSLTAVSGLYERRFLADRFQIETIVTSHDPQRMNFSENSTIQESLLVARRPGPEWRPTRFVSISRMPRDAHEAVLLSDRINRREPLGDWGSEHAWPWPQIHAGDWSAAHFYDGVLADAVHQLGTLEGARLAPAGDLCYVEPSADRVRDTFSPVPAADAPWTCPMLWEHSPEAQVTMTGRPDIAVAPRPDREDFAKNNLIKNASRLLVANRLYTSRTRVSACYADQPLLGYAWTPVIPVAPNPAFERALCAWWNSTPGVLTLLHARARRLAYPHYALDSLRALLVPDPSRVDVGPLAEVFDKTCSRALQPWPQMHDCDTRAALDYAAAQVLRIDSRAIADWRQRIACEPTVTGKSAQA